MTTTPRRLRVHARTIVSVAAIGVSLAAAATSCGVVDDGAVRAVDPPYGLSDTLAGTTTTSIPPTSSLDQTSTTGSETTVPPVQSEQARLYFIASGQLTYIAAQLPTPVTLAQLVAALQAGPPAGELGTGLRSAVPELLEIRVVTDGSGIARVELPDGFFDAMTVGDQRLVVAQLVLTLTDSRGIGQVTFDRAVPTPSGELTPPGEPLAYRDFQSLLVSSSAGG